MPPLPLWVLVENDSNLFPWYPQPLDFFLSSSAFKAMLCASSTGPKNLQPNFVLELWFEPIQISRYPLGLGFIQVVSFGWLRELQCIIKNRSRFFLHRW